MTPSAIVETREASEQAAERDGERKPDAAAVLATTTDWGASSALTEGKQERKREGGCRGDRRADWRLTS